MLPRWWREVFTQHRECCHFVKFKCKSLVCYRYLEQFSPFFKFFSFKRIKGLLLCLITVDDFTQFALVVTQKFLQRLHMETSAISCPRVPVCCMSESLPSFTSFPLWPIWLFTREKKKKTLRSERGWTGRRPRLKPKMTAWKAVIMGRKCVCVCV